MDSFWRDILSRPKVYFLFRFPYIHTCTYESVKIVAAMPAMEPPASIISRTSSRSLRSSGGYSDDPRSSSAGHVVLEEDDDAVALAATEESASIITPPAEPIQRPLRLLVGENDDNWLFLRESVNDNFGDDSVGIVGMRGRSTTMHRFRWPVLKLLLAVVIGVGIVHVSLNGSNRNSSGGGISNVEGSNEDGISSEAGGVGVGDRFEDFDAEMMTNTDHTDDQGEEEEEEEPNKITPPPNDDDVTPDWWCGTCNWKNVTDCDNRVQWEMHKYHITKLEAMESASDYCSKPTKAPSGITEAPTPNPDLAWWCGTCIWNNLTPCNERLNFVMHHYHISEIEAMEGIGREYCGLPTLSPMPSSKPSQSPSEYPSETPSWSPSLSPSRNEALDWWCGTCSWKNITSCDARVKWEMNKYHISMREAMESASDYCTKPTKSPSGITEAPTSNPNLQWWCGTCMWNNFTPCNVRLDYVMHHYHITSEIEAMEGIGREYCGLPTLSPMPSPSPSISNKSKLLRSNIQNK